jgi:aryl-alcohol dehydrogenase-like predicted oxidoreductase
MGDREIPRRSLGSTGFSVSAVGLGTWAFASQIYGEVPAESALDTIEGALDAGINFFDTAPLYGTDTIDGVAESLLGRGLAERRSDVFISSKFGRYSSDKAAPNFHARRARESVEGSLERLGTDYIDLLFFHSPFGPEDIHDDVWEELDRLRDAGKIRAIGHSISKFEDTQAMARAWASERRISAIQVVYSLMNRESSGLIRDLGAQGIDVVARESLANGFLSGAVTRHTVFGAKNINARYSHQEIEARVAYVESLAFLVRDDIKTLPQAATRWVLDNPQVSVILSGAKNPLELADWIEGSKASPFTEAEHERASALHQRDFQAA